MQANVAVTSLFTSPTNPRKNFDSKKLEELRKSVEQNGVLQPLLVRESVDKPGTYEVVDGERRRRVLTELAVLNVPVLIREMTDDEVRVAQMVSFLQRDDLHPLDEADSYRDMIETLPLDEAAARCGRTVGYVSTRLALCKLSEAGRKAYLDGALNAGGALVVARIADPKAQAKVLEHCLTIFKNTGEPISLRDASSYVQHNVMLRLKDAPFSVKDPGLVPAAGACTACPKRSGAQPELFEDISAKDDLCTDPACHASKVVAAWEKDKAAAKARELEVIEKPADVKKHFPFGGDQLQSREYQALDEVCSADKKRRTFRQILGDFAASAVIKSPTTGAPIALVKKKDLPELLKAEGVKVPAVNAPAGGSSSKKPTAKKADPKLAAKHKLDAEVEDKAGTAIVAELVARAEKLKSPLELLRYIVAFQLDTAYTYDFFDRRNWKRGTRGAQLVKSMNEGQLLGVLLELTLSDSFSTLDVEVTNACKLLGVDPKKITDGVRKQLEAAASKPNEEAHKLAAAFAGKAPAKKAAKASKAKPAKKKGKR